MFEMFFDTRIFDQNLSNWNISNVIDMRKMFYSVKLSTINYSNMLKAWAKLPVKSKIIFDGGLSKYYKIAKKSRDYLIKKKKWIITDGGMSGNIPCLTDDTFVLLLSGYVNISELKVGDQVLTDDNRIVKITRIIKTTVKGNNNTYPYIIPKNSIGPNYPPQKLSLSSNHLIKYKNKWIMPFYNFKMDKSKKLINYYHIQLENYITDNLVVNNGTVVESLTSPIESHKLERNKRLKKLLNLNNKWKKILNLDNK
jgi:hypothetical protein